MKYSIIIPTAFDKCESLLKPCIESIHKYTDLTDTEIIVVANGCTDNSATWALKQGCVVIPFPEAIGYPAAVNAGIEAAQGEFVVPFNNDNQILGSGWLEMLAAPFIDPKVAITGPWKNWCPYAEREFLIFFVAMIRKSVLLTIGMLDDKTFGVGYGEDCDVCCKAVDAGYKIVQVPIDRKLEYNGQMAIGDFPIFHSGNQTFKDHPDSELIWRNREILKQRYSFNIGRALEIDGFMSPEELKWLAKASRSAVTAIELGVWHGRSTRAIADNLPPNGFLYAIDTWNGSVAEQDTNHASAKLMDGDHAYEEFYRNLWDHIESGKVIPIRMHGKHAAKLLQDKGVQASLIFIDGGHQYSEVQDDIESFLPLRKQGGIICGHDFKQGLAPEVTQAVLDVFGQNVGHVDNTTIWFTDSEPIKRNIYDCFIFSNELDLLEHRLSTLADTVDRFVIVEATKTHSGKPKELVFDKNKDRFGKYLHKITHIVSDLPEVEGSVTDKSWARERYQRDDIMQGLTQCRDRDVIIISDLDEIPNPVAIQSYNGTNDIRCLEMDLFYYNLETKSVDKWRHAKILPYGLLKQHSPCWARYEQAEPIPNGGQHLSYFGGVEAIREKIDNTAHVEYSTDYYKDPDRIQKMMDEHRDIFERKEIKFQCV